MISLFCGGILLSDFPWIKRTGQTTRSAQSAGLRVLNSIPCIAFAVANVTVFDGHAIGAGMIPKAVMYRDAIASRFAYALSATIPAMFFSESAAAAPMAIAAPSENPMR